MTDSEMIRAIAVYTGQVRTISTLRHWVRLGCIMPPESACGRGIRRNWRYQSLVEALAVIDLQTRGEAIESIRAAREAFEAMDCDADACLREARAALQAITKADLEEVHARVGRLLAAVEWKGAVDRSLQRMQEMPLARVLRGTAL